MRRAIGKYLTSFIAIIALIATALAVGAYIVLNQDSRPVFPLLEKPRVAMNATFTDAQAVVPGQGQSVRIAGVEVGKIGAVGVQNGLAVVRMDIYPQFASRIHTDSSALLRPRTGLKDMFIELDPGTSSAPAMKAGGNVPVENTAPDVDPDEILSTLDTDTRAYLQLLVNGAGEGLKNHGNDLREVFKRFAPLHRDIQRVAGALAQRRTQLAHLIHNYGVLTNALGDNDKDLTTLVHAGSQAFEALGSQDANISQAVALLPGALEQSSQTLGKVNTLGQRLGPTLRSLEPALRSLDDANDDLLPLARQGEPEIRNDIRPFVRDAKPYVGDELRPAATNLRKAAPELTTSFLELNRFVNMLAFNPKGEAQEHVDRPVSGAEGLTGNATTNRNRREGYLFWLHWVAANGNSVFSTRDANGPFRRVLLQLSCQGVQGLFDAQAAAFAQQLPKPLADAFAEIALTLVFGQAPSDNPLCPV
ncbi:MAG: phospholipid/cholesterol/gamma-HCH transport system substrate-binding protein [Thermoleophilaceae bacterium]|jgi:phospholipid/cholesterol/gamma-HCH transport system substrate-binding protein|nr:phospholipid/cholesterol/gamma-HCH transport system substrate-binding protein [Thermoleophilaceae bacterium]